MTRAIGEIRPLLAERSCRVVPGTRLRTLAEVIAHLGASGGTAIMDATGIRRAVARHHGRHDVIDHTVRAVAGLLSDQQSHTARHVG